MRSAMRAVVVVVAASLAACVGVSNFNFPDAGLVDGGPDTSGAECDAGPDAGCASGPAGDVEACASLVAQCCGATCAHSAGCEAATLLQQFEPDQCAAALADSLRFPACEVSNCDTLVAKTCGDDDRCHDAPGCAPAKELQARATDPNASQNDVATAQSECLQALEDEVVFAPCE